MPSRLNEYPAGITRPTVDLVTPRFSIFAIIRGRTDSDDDVPRTISSSSLMYAMNLKIENPLKRAIRPRTTITNTKQVR